MPQTRLGIYYTGDSLNGIHAGWFGGYTSTFYLDYHAQERADDYGLSLDDLLDKNREWWHNGVVTTAEGKVVTNKEAAGE